METPATTFAPVHKFRFGADARDTEGAGGTVAHIIVDATSFAVTAIGVRFNLFGRVAYAPVAHVTAATESVVEFNLTSAEIEKDRSQPAGARLGNDTHVTLNGKRLGKLTQLTFNADTHVMRHLVIDRGLSGEVVISARAVNQITDSGITLGAPRDGSAATLTPFRPDGELREDVIKRLESYNRLRVDLAGINVSVIDGVLWLRGHVSSDLNRRLAQDLVGDLHGLAELHNELILDSDLATTISSALSHDPRTTAERIGVYPVLGSVRLRGAVRTPAAREAAQQLASAVPGVGEIVNELHVNPDANVLPVMASVTNTEDVVPGGR